MALKFCPKCNHGTPQLDIQIRFCSQCGYNFISASMPKVEVEEVIQPRPQKRTIARRQIEQEYYNDEEIDDEINNRSPLQEFDPPEIEIDNIPGRQTMKAESLILDKSPKERIDRPKLKISKNKKELKNQVEEMFKNDVSKKGSQEIGGF